MSSQKSSGWTARENKVFEDALASYGRPSTAEWWQNVARAVGGKSIEEVKRHYRKLVQDINHIETGKVPVPNYNSSYGIGGDHNTNNINGYKS